MSEWIASQTTRGGGRSPLESAQWRIFFVIEALGVATTLGLGLGLLGFAGALDRTGLGFWLGGVIVGLGVGFVNYVIFKITLRSQLYRFLNLFYALIERPRPKVASPFVSTELDDIEDLFGELIAELRGYVDRTVANQVTLERLQRYFSPAVVTQIVENGGMGSTGRAMSVTVLFCDLRGFTALSSKLAPEDVVALLNEYFTAMIDEIYSEQGTVLKLIGDAVMAAFGAPVPSDDDTVRAVRAGCRMQEAFGRLARDRTARGLPTPTGIGIGINRGAVVVGDIGAPHHLDYTVIGDAVNVASRLTGQASPGQVLVSETTASALGDETGIGCRPLGSVSVKGKDAPIAVFEASLAAGRTMGTSAARERS